MRPSNKLLYLEDVITEIYWLIRDSEEYTALEWAHGIASIINSFQENFGYSKNLQIDLSSIRFRTSKKGGRR